MRLAVPQRIRRAFVLIMAAGVAGWIAWVWLWPVAAGFLIRTDILCSGYVRSTQKLGGLLVRDETAVRAPADGVFQPLLADGARVNRGGLVGKLVDAIGEQELRAPRGGVVHYQVDGLEQILVPGAGTGLVVPPEGEPVHRTAGEVHGGDLLFRVVDNLSPVYLQFEVPDGRLPRQMLVSGAKWGLIWDEDTYIGRVTELLPGTGQTLLRLRLDRYPDEFLAARRLDVEVITRELKGFIVPRESIQLRDGRPGVLVLYKNSLYWRPVTIEGQIGRRVAVAGSGLNTGMRYVTNPWLVRSRDRVRMPEG